MKNTTVNAVNLRELPSFGKSVAESEANSLNKYFVKTETYLRTVFEDSRKIFYVGHRGSGKTALFKQLIHEYSQGKKNVILSMTPSDFSYEIFSKIEHDIHDMKVIYGIVWHYTLLIYSFKAVVAAFEKWNTKKHKAEVARIKSYLVSVNLLESDDLVKIFFQFFKKFRITKISAKIIDIEFENSDADQKLMRLLNMEDIRNAKKAFAWILRSVPLCIFIDELDTGWNNSKEAQNFIYGLLYAVNKLKTADGVNIFLSLRKDMYDNLPIFYTDAEKLRDDIEILSWNKESLMALITSRIVNLLPRNISRHIEPEDAVSLVFDEGVLDYIIDHTLHRPREVIQFCNQALDLFKKAWSLNLDHRGKITLEMAKIIENEFSNYRFIEICEEYKYQYPHVKDLLFLFEHSRQEFCYNDFQEKLEECLLVFVERHGAGTWLDLYFDHLDELVKVLFDIGFIKVYAPAFGKYFAYYELTFHHAGRIKGIKIHDLFCSALKLREGS